jgi:hypothetical protein
MGRATQVVIEVYLMLCHCCCMLMFPPPTPSLGSRGLAAHLPHVACDMCMSGIHFMQHALCSWLHTQSAR